jgi:hypothetical protein
LLNKDPDILVGLTTARTDFEAEIMVQALEANGIPAKAFTTAGAMLQWDVAASQPMRVMVRRRDLERAADILRAVRAESVDIDWSEAEVGVQEPGEPAPAPETGPGWIPTVRRLGMVLVILVLAFWWPLYAAAVFLIAAAIEFGFWKAKGRRSVGPPEKQAPGATHP